MSSPISSLPVELQREVASHLSNDTSTLASLCLVSQTWKAAATFPLYNRDAELEFLWEQDKILDDSWSKPHQLARTLDTRPDLASLVTGINLEVNMRSFDEDLIDKQLAVQIKSDMLPATEAFRIVFEAAANITSFRLGGCDHWLDRDAVFEMLGLSRAAPSCITHLRVGFVPSPSSLATILERHSSLTYLDIGELPTRADDFIFPPLIALKTLLVEAPLSDLHVEQLKAGGTWQSLKSIKFWPELDHPNWTKFPNLVSVQLEMSRQDVGQTAATLATCVAVEEVRVAVVFEYQDLYRLLERTSLLESIPSTLKVLDLSDTTDDLVNKYVLDWLRSGDERWPNLRKISLCNPYSVESVDREECDCMYRECEQVCQQRGIECEWVGERIKPEESWVNLEG